MINTRFDLEQHIMECWMVTTDLKLVTEYLLDAPLEPGRGDKIANMLLGMETLYEAKFDRCFRTFEKLLGQQHVDKQTATGEATSMTNFTVISDDEAVELRKLRAFYQEVRQLTVEHDVIENDEVGIAVVFPNRLGSALAKVNAEWAQP